MNYALSTMIFLMHGKFVLTIYIVVSSSLASVDATPSRRTRPLGISREGYISAAGK